MIAREHLAIRRSWRAPALAAVVLAGIAGVWLLGEHSLANLGRAALAIGGAGLVAWWSPRRPTAAFGVLFVLATLSRWTIELPIGNMRLEQPAIAAGLLALLYARRLPDRATLRRLLPIAVAFTAYLGALTASSLLHSPDRTDSLRMVFWIALSMAGGLLAFSLLFDSDVQGAQRWLRWTAAGQSTIGILIAVVFFTLGPVIFDAPGSMPGMQGKIYGVSWEANLFASLLAALSFFAIEGFRSRPRPLGAVLVALVLVGLALAQTRGAYLGLVAGMVAYVFTILYRSHRPRNLLVPVSVVAATLVVGTWMAPVLVPVYRLPNQPMNLATPGWGRQFGVGPYLLPGLPSLSGPSESVGNRSPGPAPDQGPIAGPATPDESLAFRLDRIPVALKDLVRDPIVGLGANSFDQRHVDPAQNAPDHLAILAVAALYESGLVGALGLAIGFALILLALWRATRRSIAGPLAAAYIGAVVSLLVAYQATNAINFSIIWLIAGAGLAMALRTPADESAAPG